MRALLIAALLAACATPAAPTASLDGEWILASRALRPPTIVFAGDGASGFAGCNRWFASVTRAGAALRFTGIGATRMACEEPAMAIEGDFLNVLEHTRSAHLAGDTLVLHGEDGAELASLLRAR